MSTDLIPQEAPQFFDLENPQHFANLVPASLKQKILAIPAELLMLTEQKLIAQIYKAEPPDDLHYELRLAFWEEYEARFEKCEKMSIAKMCRGICHPNYFLHELSLNSAILTFIITEPTITKNRMKYAYHLSLNEMLKTLKRVEQVSAKTGLIDSKLMELKFKIFEYVDQRLHGSLIQRQETKSINVNVKAEPEQVGLPATADEIDKRLKELEVELLEAARPTQPAQLPQASTIMEKVVYEAGRVSEEFKRER